MKSRENLGYRFHVVIMVFVCWCFSCSESKETRLQRFLIQGNEKIGEREYEQAEKYLTSALALDSCFADALNNLGTIEHQRKNTEKALTYYSKAIACRDTFLLAYANRANLYYELGEPDKGLVDVAVLAKYFPDSSAVLELRGLLLWKKRDFRGAATSFRRMISKDPTNIAALINLGTVYTASGDLDSARLFLTKALNKNRSDPRVLNAMAMLEVEGGHVETARRWIDQALDISPDDAYYLNNKGYILMRENKYDSAITFIDRSIASDPYNGWAYRNKGIYFYHTQQYSKAVEMLKRSERADLSIDELSYWLGVSLLKEGNQLEGCRYLKTAREKNDIPATASLPEC